jgi:hypothetical protein
MSCSDNKYDPITKSRTVASLPPQKKKNFDRKALFVAVKKCRKRVCFCPDMVLAVVENPRKHAT